VQDQFAVQSNTRAAAAIAAGKFADEIAPITIPQRKGDPVVISTDEGVRGNTTMDSLATLKPAFEKDGAITAGNASQLSDGASAVVVMSKKAAEARGVKPLGEVVSYGMVAGPDNASLLHQPSNAILKALGRAGLKISDINLFEINEAFAAVGIASMKELGISDSIVNVNGGAIALGHPIGMSGNRLALTVLHELRRRGGGLGAVSLCGGGGQGDALVVRSL
jgi:acetyl-CoA C-acetyltransferase